MTYKKAEDLRRKWKKTHKFLLFSKSSRKCSKITQITRFLTKIYLSYVIFWPKPRKMNATRAIWTPRTQKRPNILQRNHFLKEKKSSKKILAPAGGSVVLWLPIPQRSTLTKTPPTTVTSQKLAHALLHTSLQEGIQVRSTVDWRRTCKTFFKKMLWPRFSAFKPGQKKKIFDRGSGGRSVA